MKILSLHIDGFGKLNDRDLSFKDGLTVVYVRNEAGKSTLHTFIRGMLFGIERQRGRASKNDIYSRFEPWSKSSVYEGWLRLESQGEIFRIQRRFHRGNKSLTIVNETKGCEETPDAALWERLRCGLTETAYNNTISIGQLKSATDSGMVAELRNYIANLNTSGSIALNITRASALLKAQRREMAAKIVPEAARRYTALLGEMRAIEHEISDPRYANELAARQTERAAVKEELDSRQKEKETLLEKAARGQQILQNSHFTDETSVEEYQEQASRTYEAYRRAEADCRGMLLGPGNILCIVLSCLFMTSMGLCIGAPDTMHELLIRFGPRNAGSSPAFFTFLTAVSGLGAILFLTAVLMQIYGARRRRRTLAIASKRLSGLLKEQLGEISVSEESMAQFERRMAEYLRLGKAVRQSEEALKRLTAEIAQLQSRESTLTNEIEVQQRLQWELEQKLERLSICRSEAEGLKHVLAENERVQEELDALDLAQDTLTNLSATIRDSFGLYLNKTASELIAGITGGIYTSMSINQDLNIFMNTPDHLVPIEQVSSGTMDQIYLAVRLAAAKLVQADKDQMPLIFDDSFALYDDDRLKTALKWLSRAFQGQIILFTCHQREAQLLTANQVDFHYLTL